MIRRILWIIGGILLTALLWMACSSGSYANVQIIKMDSTVPAGQIKELVITQGPEEKKPRSYLRTITKQSMDLYIRGRDDAGNLYILPENTPVVWTVVSFIDLRQAEMAPLNWTGYPTRRIDAASTEEVVSHAIRFTVHDPGVSSPVAIEARTALPGPEGSVMFSAGVKIEVIASQIQDPRDVDMNLR
jgi:hypothetical protein